MLGTLSPTFHYRYPSTHQCEFVPLWCPNDVYRGGSCRGHVAGYACITADDWLTGEDCPNAMVMLPDWGGPCEAFRGEK